MLALSLVALFSSVQSIAVENKTECYTGDNIVKQKSQKFYCLATMMYDQLQMVGKNNLIYLLCMCVCVCMHVGGHVCMYMCGCDVWCTHVYAYALRC